MSKVVFLDIDGVLNSRVFFMEKSAKAGGIWYAKDDYIVAQFDHEAVTRLNQILEVTDAKIVVSSTWRLNHSVRGLQRIFKAVNIIGEVIGKTQSLSGDHKYPRGYEIAAWIKFGKPENYVVLEDDVIEMDMLEGHVIQTYFQYGLQDEHVEQAIEILNHE